MATAGGKVPREKLREVADEIVAYWERIAERLLPEPSCQRIIDGIGLDHMGAQKRAFEMLKKWSEMLDTEATEEKLCRALLNEDKKATAAKLFGDELVARLSSVNDGHKAVQGPEKQMRISEENIEIMHCDFSASLRYSVEQYVLKKDGAYDTLKGVINEIGIVRGVASGLDYLHRREKPITHINLTPAGVRIMEKNGKAVAKICLASTSSTLNEQEIAMEGFMAPEFTNPDVDVFSFGCFAYYVITKGEHPFSKPGSGSSELSEIQSRIDSGKFEPPNFEALEDLVNESMQPKVDESREAELKEKIRRIGNPAAALALVKSTLDKGKKPSSCCITSHCYFFNPERQCHFHQDFNNSTPFYEGKKTGNMDMDPLLDELSEHKKEVFGSIEWGVKLRSFGAKIEIEKDQVKVAYKDKRGKDAAKKYKNSIQDFLNFLRDQFSHELNDEKKREFWESDDKKALILNRGFPRLLPVCWDISKKMPRLSKYHCDEKH